jgi:hypothetical protein
VPLYQKVSTLHKRTKGAFQFIAVSSGAEGDLLEFLAANLIEADRIIPAKTANLGIRGTPTVLLVDRHGTVVSSWRGALNNSDESALLEALQKPPLRSDARR